MKSPSGEILTIGTEILLGEIVDSNSATIAKALRHAGLNLFTTSTVGDNQERISRALMAALDRADFVIMTGGLGPTVDDMTRQAVAKAAGVELTFQPDLWQQVRARFARFGRKPGENNRRQAFLPVGAIGLENPIGTAPAFLMELPQGVVYALPGVPAEMEGLLSNRVIPDLKDRFDLKQKIISRLLRTAGVGESTLDAQIKDLEESANPTLGIAAHPGRVDLRLTARADSQSEAEAMLDEMESELRQRIGQYILGHEEDSLESVVLGQLKVRGLSLVTAEAGTGGALAGPLAQVGGPFRQGFILPNQDQDQLQQVLEGSMGDRTTTVGLGLLLRDSTDGLQIFGWIVAPELEDHFTQDYGGPPSYAPAWGASLLLERLRRRIQD